MLLCQDFTLSICAPYGKCDLSSKLLRYTAVPSRLGIYTYVYIPTYTQSRDNDPPSYPGPQPKRSLLKLMPLCLT